MFFTTTSPAGDPDRVELYPNVNAALADARRVRFVFAVAVRLDDGGRRVVPLRPDPRIDDPHWVTPAEHHGDGSITVKGPIPRPLYEVVRRSTDRSERST